MSIQNHLGQFVILQFFWMLLNGWLIGLFGGLLKPRNQDMTKDKLEENFS